LSFKEEDFNSRNKDFAFNFSAFGGNFTCTKYADDKPPSFVDKEAGL